MRLRLFLNAVRGDVPEIAHLALQETNPPGGLPPTLEVALVDGAILLDDPLLILGPAN